MGKYIPPPSPRHEGQDLCPVRIFLSVEVEILVEAKYFCLLKLNCTVWKVRVHWSKDTSLGQIFLTNKVKIYEANNYFFHASVEIYALGT